MKVQNLSIREVLASNSQKTIELELETGKGKVRSSVPIGTSRGKYEIFYLPVDDAIEKFSSVKSHFISKSFMNQEDVDDLLKILDKSIGFKEIGGNLALGISSAFLKAFALEYGKDVFEFLSEKPTIPLPVCNVAGGWKGQSDIQEFLLLPSNQRSFLESINKISRSYFHLRDSLKKYDRSFNFGKNIESAWITSLPFQKVLEILAKIAGDSLEIGMDVAASELWNGKKYVYRNGNLNTPEQLSLMEELGGKYSLKYIEDPFYDDDFVSFSNLTERLKDRIIVGDDLFTTNPERLQYGISYKSASGIIVKPSQIGTITDVIKVVQEAKKNKMKTIISHRSGETDDTLISHLATGLNCDYIKLGISGERIVKINEMIRIEEKLGS
jgi:enolase 1/2/3